MARGRKRNGQTRKEALEAGSTNAYKRGNDLSPAATPLRRPDSRPSIPDAVSPQWTPRSLRHWDRIADDFRSRGLDSVTFEQGIDTLARLLDIFDESMIQIEDFGPFIEDEKGVIRPNPGLSTAHKYGVLIRQFLSELGITPSSMNSLHDGLKSIKDMEAEDGADYFRDKVNKGRKRVTA